MFILGLLAALSTATYVIIFVYATSNFFENIPNKSISAKRNIELALKKTIIRTLEIIPADANTLARDKYIRMGAEVTREARMEYERRLRYLLVKDDNNVVPVEMMRREDMEALYELQTLNPGQTFYVTIELVDTFPLVGKKILDVRYDYDRLPPERQLSSPENHNQLH